MSDQAIDSKAAARAIGTLLLVAVGIGAVCGLATWGFLTFEHVGIVYLWETLPEMIDGAPAWAVSFGVVAVMTALAALIAALYGKRPFDMGEAEGEYDREGRMDYRNVPAGIAFSLFSLFSGAAVGPEAPLTDINGGLGTLIAERLKLEPEQIKTMAYAGVAGAFAAFFGAAPVGALLAAELIDPKSTSISRTTIVSGLGSGAAGWTVFAMLGGQRISALLTFPTLDARLGLADLGFAAVLGVVGGALGLAYGKVLLTTRLKTQKLRARPWLAALAGGVPVALAAVLAPYLLFSGTEQVGPMIEKAATIGAISLLAIGVAKLLLSAWSMSTAYFGGPIFPIILAGTCFGLAVNLLVPGIPQGVAVISIATGMVIAAAVAPLSITIFMSLIADPELAPAIAIAAVAAFVVRQLLAPTLPGIYRATRAVEKRATQAG